MSIENTLERIATALEEIASKAVDVVAIPTPAKRTRKKKETTLEPIVAPPVVEENNTQEPVVPPVAPPSTSVTTVDQVRAAAAPLVKISGAGNRAGYEAAQAIIVKYGASIAEIPPADRATVITELNAALENWGL